MGTHTHTMVSRGDLLKEFFECDEVQQSGLGGGDCSNRDAIKFIFIATLGRMPNEGEEWDYHANDLEGKGFEAKCDEFCGCPEFETYLHDNTEEDAKMGDADDLSVGRYLVQNVFRNVLRRGYTKAEYEFHAGRIDEEEITPVQFCKEIIDCPEFESLGVDKSPENLVRLFCRVFLGRLANDGDVEYHAPRIADGMEPEDLATEFVELTRPKRITRLSKNARHIQVSSGWSTRTSSSFRISSTAFSRGGPTRRSSSSTWKG